MIRKDTHKLKGGIVKTQVRVVESYRPDKGANPRQRTIKDFGYLEAQPDKEAFLAEVKAFDEDYKAGKVTIMMEFDTKEQMYSGDNARLNYGHKFLNAVYDALHIEEFLAQYMSSKDFKGKYPLGDIFKFLVLSRILAPDSKRASCQLKDMYYGFDTEFELEDIYHALGHMDKFSARIQRYLNEQVQGLIGRDLSYAFYDMTNYFFEIDYPDGDDDLRQKGVSKEHRISPIVEMGMFIDCNGLPVCMSIHKGSDSETLSLEPNVNELRTTYHVGRIVAVADKGLNSSKNIDMLVNNGDGFVFSQQLRGTKGKRYHKDLFDPTGWISNNDGSYQYKLIEEKYTGCDKEGKKVERTRKALLYWDKADAQMAQRKREVKLRKAEKSIKNNAYGIKHGYEEYTKELIVNKDTGEIIDDDVAKVLTVDEDKAEKDARFDGYFAIITSELDYDAKAIREVYGGLWKIEQSFRILKSDLSARPVFVWTNEHIRAHFLICFVALLIIRVIQHRMGQDAISVERIACALRAAICRIRRGGLVELDDIGGALEFGKRTNKKGKLVDTLYFNGEDEVAKDYQVIQSTFGTSFYSSKAKQEDFNRFLRQITI